MLASNGSTSSSQSRCPRAGAKLPRRHGRRGEGRRRTPRVGGAFLQPAARLCRVSQQHPGEEQGVGNHASGPAPPVAHRCHDDPGLPQEGVSQSWADTARRSRSTWGRGSPVRFNPKLGRIRSRRQSISHRFGQALKMPFKEQDSDADFVISRRSELHGHALQAEAGPGLIGRRRRVVTRGSSRSAPSSYEHPTSRPAFDAQPQGVAAWTSSSLRATHESGPARRQVVGTTPFRSPHHPSYQATHPPRRWPFRSTLTGWPRR